MTAEHPKSGDSEKLAAYGSALIEAIHVAPKSKAWFSELVSLVSQRYGLKAPIKQSSLDQDPIY